MLKIILASKHWRKFAPLKGKRSETYPNRKTGTQ